MRDGRGLLRHDAADERPRRPAWPRGAGEAEGFHAHGIEAGLVGGTPIRKQTSEEMTNTAVPARFRAKVAVGCTESVPSDDGVVSRYGMEVVLPLSGIGLEHAF